MIDGLDPVIHVPQRLAAMAILANAPSVSFRFLKEQLQLADSGLSKQMSARKAYATHCAALRALIDSVPATDR